MTGKRHDRRMEWERWRGGKMRRRIGKEERIREEYERDGVRIGVRG